MWKTSHKKQSSGEFCIDETRRAISIVRDFLYYFLHKVHHHHICFVSNIDVVMFNNMCLMSKTNM